MNIIEHYCFGLIVVNGKEYSSDVIISPDSVKDNWWRREGHQLCLSDLTGVMAEDAEVLVVGTGMSDMMKVLPDVEHYIDKRGIKLIVETTDKACHTYNQICQSQRVVAALHLTC